MALGESRHILRINTLERTPTPNEETGHSYLLDLPPELRLRIYDFVYEGYAGKRITCFITTEGALGYDGYDNPGPPFEATTSALFRTCRMIHWEALPVLYESVHSQLSLLSKSGRLGKWSKAEKRWKPDVVVPQHTKSMINFGKLFRNLEIRTSLRRPAANAQVLERLCALLEVPAVQLRHPIVGLFYPRERDSPINSMQTLQQYEKEAKNREIGLDATTVAGKIWSAVLSELKKKAGEH
ncbi:uncharacterized protein LTR77_007065 [Saxophila tyrrhenica]|uniref:Uncharacterized protein n=1 Tax=Saxophila tyrrhenica TaxID=1690608 RepID=A0AAV9P3N4_9PEZI|nr:hypothetical protein LTR77_007065 [Saxophila tyrrhenica]